MFKTRPDKGCVLVIGGAKSGKSRISLDICNGLAKKKVFIATAQALDDEMKERIERHRKERGGDWITVEEPVRIVDSIREVDRTDKVILVDCLTLWINNLFMKHDNSLQPVHQAMDELVEELTNIKGVIILVSNEVGMGIVPENGVARVYRDMAGSLNQRIAGKARKVVTVMAGIPLVLKDE
jgi:adenosyl cobinamide kinase/adenosyl cobinamide phosphate guanylyltransferase